MQISYDQRISGKSILALGQTILDSLIEIELKGNKVLRLEPAGRSVSLRGIDGALWVTQAGDLQDYVLQPGEVLTLFKGGIIIVQALGYGRLQASDDLEK